MLIYWLLGASLLFGKSFCQCSGNSSDSNEACYMGDCIDNKCECFDGWGGNQCDTCSGRILLNETEGVIFDGPKNYSNLSKCSWLIKPGMNHTTLRLRFNEFASECGWDHLYVYDGDSAFAPLIGAFNGLLNGTSAVEPEVIAHSGSAFLHFSSDQAFTLSGFNISYSVDECKYNCSGQGTCDDGLCICDGNSTGRHCNLCECGNSTVPCVDGVCPDNENITDRWSVMEFTWPGRASFSLTPYNNSMWIFGGLRYDMMGGDLIKLDAFSGRWEEVAGSDGTEPSPRYEHSAVEWNGVLLVFGGKLLDDESTVDELWSFHIADSTWTRVNYTSDFGRDSSLGSNWNLKLAGHASELVSFGNGTDLMVVLFGYHPTTGLSPLVFEYQPRTGTWILPRTTGARQRGLFGHTTVYDSASSLIYIHGGMQSGFSANPNTRLTDQTLSYHPESRKFEMLSPSDRPRYLHSSVIYNGTMFVYGGSAHNDSSSNDQCYSSDLLAYYVEEDRWQVLSSPAPSLQPRRYGHQSTVSDDGRLYFLSGYDSTMIRNMLIYDVPTCSDYNEETCETLSVQQGALCQWDGNCLSANELQSSVDREAFCKALSGVPCETCLNTPYNCLYCGSKCGVDVQSCNATCPVPRLTLCASLYDCQLCESVPYCEWDSSVTRCVETTSLRNSSVCNANATCDTASSCGECGRKTNCMWCQNLDKCIATNSYVLQFPYGQCIEWVRAQNCPDYACSSHQTCAACHNHTECGWCDDGSMTGKGSCVEGGGSGPRNSTSSGDTCPDNNWFFTSCPPCQCNGHSVCDSNNECIDCEDNTTGEQCQRCADGFFGNPLNGGNCTECQCGEKADNCDFTTGSCFCSTKGEIGMTCEECDNNNGYFGDAEGNGTCYYNIQENYIFTFTLTTPGDEHVTAINFQNRPSATDDVDLSLSCDHPSSVKLGVLLPSGVEVTVLQVHNVTSLSYNFDSDLYNFGESNATIRIYVANFTVPFEVKVSLLQYNNALLRLLLIIFSTLLAALIVGALIWKIKLMWDNHRLRANRAIQMKEMAARPFAGITLHCDDIYRSTKALLSPNSYEKPDTADVFCEETCGTGNAAVASVFLWLPSNVPADKKDQNKLSDLYLSPPPGQSALAIGTVLLTPAKKSSVRTEEANVHV